MKVIEQYAFSMCDSLQSIDLPKQLEMIKSEVRKCKQFKQVYFVEASVATVSNAGLGSIGFAIYK